MTKKVCIIGSGELGKQLFNLAHSLDEIEVVGFFDDTKKAGDLIIDSVSVIGKISDIPFYYKNGYFNALLNGIGYKHMGFRQMVFNMFKGEIPFQSLVHNSVLIDRHVSFGEGIIIYPGCIIDKNVSIHDNVLLNIGVVVSHDSSIGANTFIAPRVTIAGFVEISNSCFLGLGTIISDSIKIYENIILGAGSLVVNDLENPGLYYGSPARFIHT